MFEGVLTALVTPLRDGEIDEDALRASIDRQIEAGVDGLVPCGSTGESATLSHAEHRRVVVDSAGPVAELLRTEPDRMADLIFERVRSELLTATDAKPEQLKRAVAALCDRLEASLPTELTEELLDSKE